MESSVRKLVANGVAAGQLSWIGKSWRNSLNVPAEYATLSPLMEAAQTTQAGRR
jgi:hypothetical protein